MASKASALSKFVTEVKGGDKAKLSISKTLEAIIEKYCVSGEFDAWLEDHYADAAKYLQPQHNAPRQGVFRASASGKCIQQQLFKIVKEPETDAVTRPGRQNRALYNGTFSHVRWHMLFDALHEKGVVKTIAAEELRYDPALELSGTIDRVVELVFNGKLVRVVIDFKTIKRQYFEALYGPQADHTQQQHAYDFFKWGADSWAMLYECKDSHDLKIYDKPYAPEILADLQEKYRLALLWREIYLRNRKRAKPDGIIDRAMIDVLPSVIDPREIGTPAEKEEFRAEMRAKVGEVEPLPKLELNTDWCRYCAYQKRCLELNPGRDKNA